MCYSRTQCLAPHHVLHVVSIQLRTVRPPDPHHELDVVDDDVDDVVDVDRVPHGVQHPVDLIRKCAKLLSQTLPFAPLGRRISLPPHPLTS